MKKKLIATVLGLSMISIAGCTEAQRANMTVFKLGDKAELTCYNYGKIIYQGKSTGKVEANDGNRYIFVEEGSEKVISVNKDNCVMVY
jgi:hypothetical protein